MFVAAKTKNMNSLRRGIPSQHRINVHTTMPILLCKGMIAIIVILLLNTSQLTTAEDYGVDISWPMHHRNISTNYPWLSHNVDPDNYPVPEEYKDMKIQPLGNIAERYFNYINGCVTKFGKKGARCWENEYDRIEMSLRQPQSMKNYTKMGFTKIRAPAHVFQLLKDFWDANKDNQKPESWYAGNVYTNNWEVPTSMVSVEDEELQGGGFVLKQHIWHAARDTLEAWTGYKQAECSLYGIRVYKEGSMLAPHVDRLPLVSSAIINVDQDVDEPWPLEVIGHDGKAYNVTMLPGDMVLYESHSVLHGRQFPLKGRFMANVFIHFEPVGPSNGQVEYTGDLPPYLIPGSLEEPHWRSRNPGGHKLLHNTFTTGSTDLHMHAQNSDYDKIERSLNENEHLVNVPDANGWTPLHEAVRAGSFDIIELLLNRGADINARVHPDGTGGSVLYIFKKEHGKSNKINGSTSNDTHEEERDDEEFNNSKITDEEYDKIMKLLLDRGAVEHLPSYPQKTEL